MAAVQCWKLMKYLNRRHQSTETFIRCITVFACGLLALHRINIHCEALELNWLQAYKIRSTCSSSSSVKENQRMVDFCPEQQDTRTVRDGSHKIEVRSDRSRSVIFCVPWVNATTKT